MSECENNLRNFIHEQSISTPVLLLPFAHRAKSASNNTTTIMECDSCWVPDGQHEPALY